VTSPERVHLTDVDVQAALVEAVVDVVQGIRA
jgi:hypothetical protein